MTTLGLLDWGIGGVGVLGAIRALRPDVDVVYLSDSGATPYGKLDRDALTARVGRAIGKLAEEGATTVVVACNAASTVLADVRPAVPTTGMITHAARAVADVRGVVGVVGGARTVRSGVYRRALARADVEVRQRIAQPLSAHIEAGAGRSATCLADVTRITQPLRGVNALLLACTHYPAIADVFEAALPGTRIVDPAAEVARAVVGDLPRDVVGRRRTRALCTGDAAAMRSAARRAFGTELPEVERVSIGRTGPEAGRFV